MIRRVQGKFEAWRQEPEEVRLRIVTLLTGATGVVVGLLWLFVLLPLQLHLNRTADPAQLGGQVSGVRDVVTPTPTPTVTPDVQYYHNTRPSLQDTNSR